MNFYTNEHLLTNIGTSDRIGSNSPMPVQLSSRCALVDAMEVVLVVERVRIKKL